MYAYGRSVKITSHIKAKFINTQLTWIVMVQLVCVIITYLWAEAKQDFYIVR
jgi:hypothetical protein